MKKIISILILVFLIISMTGVCFAAPVDVIIITYEADELILEGLPGAAAVTTALPKTGGIPAEAFYAVGALLILAAGIIAFKPRKSPAGK